MKIQRLTQEGYVFLNEKGELNFQFLAIFKDSDLTFLQNSKFISIKHIFLDNKFSTSGGKFNLNSKNIKVIFVFIRLQEFKR